MKLTNAMNLPEPFVDAVGGDYTYTDKRYSVTSVLKGTREAILQRRHDNDISEDVSDRVWAIFGTAVHSILQNSEESDTQLKENKIVVDMPNGYELSGIFDLYDDATGTVTDYKTASVWKVKFGEFEDWRMQTLIYCWMLRRIGFDASRGEIVALLKDHSKTKAKFGEHPAHPVYRIGFDFTEEDFEYIRVWLKERFEEIERCEALPDAELPLCSEADRWAKPTKYAVMKPGRKKAIRLFDRREEAEARAKAEGHGCYVEDRPSRDGKCPDYCSACRFCDYWQSKYGNEEQ